MSLLRLALLSVLAAVTVALVSGCGSSKPAFCGDVTKLQDSIKNVNASEGSSALKSQLQSIATQAGKLVSSAKSSFPTETSAVSSSLATLENEVKAISGTPSASQVATLAVDAKAFVTDVQSLATTTKDKCK